MEETQAEQGPNLGIYKNPELIESVVVFDPIGGANLTFLDKTELYFAGNDYRVAYTPTNPPAGRVSGDWSVDGGGPTLAQTTSGSPYKVDVCREVTNPGGLSARDLQGAATNPIQFRFDGIPMVLPRESYIEVTLNMLYLGPDIAVTRAALGRELQGLKSNGWARTASGLIQLVQAVDVSATSFQSPDMTTQNFLEAVQTKDTEIALRPDYYFNSFITGGTSLPKDLADSVTLVTTFESAFTDLTLNPNSGATAEIPEDDYIELHALMSFPVTMRIPLAALSAVFKTDVLPLYMTNSTSINIQFQVQNPNVGFPLHNPMSGNADGTGKLAKYAWTKAPGSATYLSKTYGNIFSAQNTEILTWASAGGSATTTVGSVNWDFQRNPDGTQGMEGPTRVTKLDGAIYKKDDTLGANRSIYSRATIPSSYAAGNIPEANGWNGTFTTVETPIISPQGFLNYVFWDTKFTIKAFIKTYASVYQNPLAERYLRPYMVGGPDGGASFFRSSFLSYSFNSQTVVVPPNGSINFAFNISQTLLNVPMAYVMFSEISYESEMPNTYMAPVGVSWASNAEGQFSVDRTITPGPVVVTTGSGDTAVTRLQALNALDYARSDEDQDYVNHTTIRYGLLDVFHRSQYYISPFIDIKGVQVQIGPSGWNLYQRPLDIKAMNEITINTLSRYDSEMAWSERLKHQQRFHLGDAFACFDLSHDLFRGLFIDSDNMLNITGMLFNSSAQSRTIYMQCVLPYIDHFVISLADATVSKSQL